MDNDDASIEEQSFKANDENEDGPEEPLELPEESVSLDFEEEDPDDRYH